MTRKTVYLDYGAATPVDPEVLVVMQPYFTEKFYNPSATYLAAQTTHKELNSARSKTAHVIGARPSEIIFTAGGTEANNLAVKGVLDQYPGSEVLVSSVEHESVLAPAKNYTSAEIPVTADGTVDLIALEKLMSEKTVLISVMYANNEVGTVQPIRKITQLVEVVRNQRRKEGNSLPLYVHTDACQAGNYLDLHVSRLGIDLMTINGGKIYGPKQSGALFVSSQVRLKPQIEGGGQERNIRSGTENVAQAVGFAEALEQAQANRHEHAESMRELQAYFIAKLSEKIPNVVINGAKKHRLPNNVHVTFTDQDNERLIFALDEKGIMAAAGSACSASNEEPSHVLRAMGVLDEDAQASLRFTMGKTTTKADIDYTVQTLAEILYTKA
jgi:cysteine desulfurase